MEEFNRNGVVISGLSGSFPKADNVEEFMEKLFAKENLLQNVPNMPCKMGKMKNLDKFDAQFFGFNLPHRVNLMDPMSRIIMEKAYEALIDSGTNPVTLKDTSCGVYVGVHCLETESLTYDKIQKGATIATARSFLANRISYWLGTYGPSFIVDGACSSSLIALEMAYKAICKGECESALVGGCHVCLHPAQLLHLLKLGALNPNGESRVFDESAGGFCRAESIGMFYLQRAKDAKRIYTQVLNVRSNHDGAKPIFLSPNGSSQSMLLKMIYKEANIDPNLISWIEAHATGTKVGDKEEVIALDKALASSRNSPLLIGSVKSNMGHAEAAAGVASLAKVIIAMETGFIPPNINLTNLRKAIDAFESGRIKVVTEKTAWPGGIVGVSGFGLGGGNTHVILKSFTKEKMNLPIPLEHVPRIVAVSGRTEEALDVLLNHLEMASIDIEFIGLLHQIHKYNIPGHLYRGFAILHKHENCIMKKIEIDECFHPIMFIYTNYLSNWSNIYKSLKGLDVFETTIQKCGNILSRFSLNLVDILDNGSAQNIKLFNGFIASVTIQIALTDLMINLKIKPDFTVGFSIAELVCAYVAGCLTLEEAVTAAYHCAAFLCKKLENTSDTLTVVVDKQFSDLRSLVPKNLTLTFPSIVCGPTNDVSSFLTANQLTSTKILNADLQTPAASDASKLQVLLQQILSPKPKSSRPEWLSSFKPVGETGTAEYFVECLSSSVNVDSIRNCLPSQGVVAIDFLVSKLFDISRDLAGESRRISLTHEISTTNISDVLFALGELYLYGCNPNLDRLYPPINYPVSRGTKMISPLIRWKHEASWPVAFSSLQERMLSGERKLAVSLDEKEDAFLSGHQIGSTILYPGTGYLILAWETLALIHGKLYTKMPVVFEHVRFRKAVALSRSESVVFNIMVNKGSGDFEILENSEIVASGRVYMPSNMKKEKMQLAEPVKDEVILDQQQFYTYILARGYHYKGLFRNITQINSQGTKARVLWNKNWVAYLNGLLQLSVLGGDHSTCLTVPVEIEKITIDTDTHDELLNSNVTEIETIKDKQLNVTESGGVQMKGCIFRPLPPKLSDRILLVQKYEFTPYMMLQELSLEHAVYLFFHTIMDYFGQQAIRLKMAEVVDEDTVSSTNLLSSLFSRFLAEQPFFQAEIKVYYSSRDEVKRTKSDLASVFGKLPLGEPVHVIVSTEIFNGHKLEQIWNSLHEDGFLIACQPLNTDEVLIPSNWSLLSNVLTRDNRFLLLKKTVEMNTNSFKIIEVSSTTFEWVKELQEALKVHIYERIIIYSERQPLNGILGFYNYLRMENGTEHVRCFFLLDTSENFSLTSEFYRGQVTKDLAINVYMHGEWGCYVRQPVGPPEPVKVHHAFVNTSRRGMKHTLKWFQGPLNSTLMADEDKLIHIYYAAINHTDVLIYKNRLARETIVKNDLRKDYVFGIEFSGRSSNSGTRYMGLLAHGCMSTLIDPTEEDIFINKVPDNWSLEDAVTIPMAYYIAIYALVMCCKLRLNSEAAILIHSAGSVIGQAAISVANYYGCKIFLTIDSTDEKIFIRENFPFIPNSMICSSSDTQFERTIMESMEGRGVDIILNTLAENKMNATVNCLARCGQFVQIKRTDFRNSNLNMNVLLSKNISLHSALLEDIFNLDLKKRIQLRNTVAEHMKNGVVKPLGRAVYCYDEIELAFKSQASNHLRKCIVQIKAEEKQIKVKPQLSMKEANPRFMCKNENTYIVCDCGLGGMAIELMNWLVKRGAKKIVITSLKGVSSGSHMLFTNLARSYGVQIKMLSQDITSQEDVVKLLKKANQIGEVGGIFNLAGIQADRPFQEQTAESFKTYAAPKLDGILNLDQISQKQCPNLEHFVICSSVPSVYGSSEQTNYGMFKSIIERICEQRHNSNLPTLAIEWGPLMDINNENRSHGGYYMQSVESCLEVLDLCLCQKNPIIASFIVTEK